LSFWLVVSDCTLIQIISQKGISKQNKVKTYFEQFICHLQIDFK